MKILIIKTAGLGYDGLTRVVLNLLNYFPRNDFYFDSVVVSTPTDEYKKAFESRGGKVYEISRATLRPLRYINQLTKLIKREKYDVVHAHGNSRTLCLEMIAAKMAGCRIRIAHSHNTSCTHRILHFLLTPFFVSNYTHGFACSNEAGKWLFGKRQFKIIPNAIDVEKFEYNSEKRESIRKKIGISCDSIVIGQVGALMERKNPIFSLNLFETLSNDFTNFKLIYIGDGELREEIEKRVCIDRKNDDVYISGYVSNVNEYLNAIDILLLPSFYEGFPLTALEAEANGLPVICSDTITNEIKIADNVSFLSLDDMRKWIDIINSIDFADRKNESLKAIDKLKKAGYSLSDTCVELAKMYSYSKEHLIKGYGKDSSNKK